MKSNTEKQLTFEDWLGDNWDILQKEGLFHLKHLNTSNNKIFFIKY
jgi:hypothetical protein